MKRLRELAQRLKGDMVALWFCSRHPRTPLVAKALVMGLVVYAFSPIDLIPDFIPVLGLLDDLLILPVGTWLVLQMVPADVMAECQEQATRGLAERRPKPRSYTGAVVVAALWLAAIVIALYLVL